MNGIEGERFRKWSASEKGGSETCRVQRFNGPRNWRSLNWTFSKVDGLGILKAVHFQGLEFMIQTHSDSGNCSNSTPR